MAKSLPKFQQVQYEFTAHIRDPEGKPMPTGISERGMKLYCELAFNNIKTFVRDNFPVIHKIITPEHAEEMARDYFIHHQARTPLFSQLGNEFIAFLENERKNEKDPPFLAELAHYEWMESALRVDPRELDFTGVNKEGDLLEGVPALSVLAWPLAYRYPVHRLSPEYVPAEPPKQQTYLIVYRDTDYHVGFIELNAVSARLIELILEMLPASGSKNKSAKTGRELLLQIAEEMQHTDPQVVIDGGKTILEQWRDRQILLGTR